MTSSIIPALVLAVLFLGVWKFHLTQQESAVFWYKLLYYWRRLLSSIQPSGIDQLEDGVVFLNRAYRVMDMNVVAEKMLEQTAVTLIGQPVATICPTIASKLEQAAKGKFEVVRDDFVPARTYELCLKAISSWQKKPAGFILIISDITARKTLENMRRDMTHTLVHDLRAPLSNSIFALQMLEMHLNGSTTPEALQMIGMTISNTEKILDRVNKILDVERLESTQMPLALAAVSLPDVIENVLVTQASRIKEKKLDIVTYVPDSLAMVWADAGLLERVVQNLVDNSIKFTPAGGEIVMAVTAIPQSHPAAVHISVSDTGTGIPINLQATIFDKFASAAEKGGSGLGLSFCKMALIAHGQDIWVESEPGRGTIFTFSLALATQPHHRLTSQIPA